MKDIDKLRLQYEQSANNITDQDIWNTINLLRHKINMEDIKKGYQSLDVLNLDNAAQNIDFSLYEKWLSSSDDK